MPTKQLTVVLPLDQTVTNCQPPTLKVQSHTLTLQRLLSDRGDELLDDEVNSLGVGVADRCDGRCSQQLHAVVEELVDLRALELVISANRLGCCCV